MRHYTGAQFARRAGISESRFRALLSEGGRLPEPDGLDPDGRPWWRATTIDRWCADTGRALPADASWPHGWPAATTPAPLMLMDVITLADPYGAGLLRMGVLVWDTAQGHVVLLAPMDGHLVNDVIAARAAAHVLPQASWAGAIILRAEELSFDDEWLSTPRVWTYQLIMAPTDLIGDPDAAGVAPAGPSTSSAPHARRRISTAFRGLWNPTEISRNSRATVSFGEEAAAGSGGTAGRSTPPRSRRGPAHPGRTDLADLPGVIGVRPGQATCASIARVLGRPVPLWWTGTCTPEVFRRIAAYGHADPASPGGPRLPAGQRPIIVPDTSTEWPATLALLETLTSDPVRLHTQSPQAFAALAREALQALEATQALHAAAADSGPGWVILARPAYPTWSIPLEQITREAAQIPHDPDTAATELIALRERAADLPWDDPHAAALETLCQLLSLDLHDSHPDIVYSVPVRIDTHPSGPVIAQYLHTLTPLPEPDMARLRQHPTLRLARLLTSETDPRALTQYGLITTAAQQLKALSTDPAGRLVAQLEGDGRTLLIEWPATQPPAWNEATVIAADHADNTVAFALTPTPEGQMLVDPLPNPGALPGYTWGYPGTGPATFYDALTRCTQRTWARAANDLPAHHIILHEHPDTGESLSALWAFIQKQPGHSPIRLPWPQVVQWVNADRALLGR